MPISRVPMSFTPSIQAGRLRHRIDIVQVTSAQDSMGGVDVSLDVVYANVWAAVYSLSALDKWAAHEFVSQVTHQVVIRYIGAAPSWQPDFTVSLGTLCVDANGNLQQAQGPGVTGEDAPAWNADPSTLTPDGDGSTEFNWYNLGVAPPSTGVVKGMQVWFKNRQYQIEGVLNPDERNKMLVLMCIEVNDSIQQSPSYPGDIS
jgi:head-tail adaptor